MSNFADAINMYYAEHGNFPQSLDALTEVDPKTGDTWMERIPADPWGQPYDYRILDSKKFILKSYGEDVQEGTADDIIWPKEG
jgi:hypothetical protein